MIRELFRKRTSEAMQDTIAAMELATRAMLDDEELFELLNRERTALRLERWSYKLFSERILMPARMAAAEGKRQQEEQARAGNEAEKRRKGQEKKRADAQKLREEEERLKREAEIERLKKEISAKK